MSLHYISHLVKKEIMHRGLPMKTAISETARAFGLSKETVEKAAFAGTGLKLAAVEEICNGPLLKGDLVLHAKPEDNQNRAFTVVTIDGPLSVQQCHLVFRLRE